MADTTQRPGPSSWIRASRRWWVAGLIVAMVGVGLAIAQTQRGTVADTKASLKPAKIDGKRAYRYLQDICKVGPHPAGSEANTKVRAMVAKHFKEHGATIKEQSFNGTDPLSGKPVAMVNLIASWNPDRIERVAIGVHYDTRPFPDEDPVAANQKIPFIGANDPASGVAIVMEIAHHLKEMPTPWGVDIVLFDGEELVYGSGPNHAGDYFLGSKAFARDYASKQRSRTRATPRYTAGIVLDLIGGKDLNVTREQYSVELAPRLVREVWAVAKALEVKQFSDRLSRVAVQDDHLPMNDAGIPTIDIIDFDYPHWHTSKDLPDQCSAESLEAVGKVVTAWLNKPKTRR